MKASMQLTNIDETFKKLFKEHQALNKVETKRVVGNMVEELKARTPIDTGNARNSWSSYETGNGVNVENSAEYIQYLNNGSSKQAPARFVEGVAIKYGTPISTIVEVKS